MTRQTVWAFRVRFSLHDGTTLNSDAEKLEIFRGDSPEIVTLYAGEKGVGIKGSSQMKLYGLPFDSEIDAWNGAHKARMALLLWAVTNNIGIDLLDVYDSKERNLTGPGGTFFYEKLGLLIRDDNKGIDVFEVRNGKLPTRLKANEVRLNVKRSIKAFVTEFKQSYVRPPSVNEKLRLACELFCASFFDSSPRSRFLTLITCVEVLLTLVKRPESVRKFIEGAIENVNDLKLESREYDSLVSGLRQLRYESIGSAGRKLAAATLGPSRMFGGLNSAEFFKYCYKIRSEIVHAGKPNSGDVDMQRLAGDCNEFVGELLREMLKGGLKQ